MNDRITSSENPIIKRCHKLLHQRKYRDSENALVLESNKIILDAYNKYPYLFENVLLSDDRENNFKDTRCTQTTHDLIQKTAYAKHAQDMLAILQKPQYDPDNVISTFKLGLILDHIQHPGNLGAIIRNAVAFNVDVVFLSPNSTDPFHPDSVRASAGSILDIPILSSEFITDQLHSIPVFGLDVNGTKTLDAIDIPSRSLWIFGSEGHGIQMSSSYTSVSIPMSDKIESLNVAVTTGIVLQHIHKQRNLV